MARLIELANGDLIDPAAVSVVRYLPSERYSTGETRAAAAVVWLRSDDPSMPGQSIYMAFATDDAAKAERERVGQLVNEAG